MLVHDPIVSRAPISCRRQPVAFVKRVYGVWLAVVKASFALVLLLTSSPRSEQTNGKNAGTAAMRNVK